MVATAKKMLVSRASAKPQIAPTTLVSATAAATSTRKEVPAFTDRIAAV